MRFTAVVVIHDSAGDLARLLASLHRHLDPLPQLVVVDAGSRDGGGELARRAGADVVALGGNPGFGAANNAGLERAGEAVTVLLNPDVELFDGGLARLAARAAKRDALFAPRLLSPDGRLQRTAHPVPGRREALLPALLGPALPGVLRLRAEPWRAARERPVGWAIAACLAARTATLRALGPFDPTAFLFYEDLDLCLRARARGIPTRFVPSVALRHRGAHSTGPAFGGEPHELLAARRRAVVRARLGERALRRDDLAQGLTFATRALAKRLLGRPAARERAQLVALRRTRARPALTAPAQPVGPVEHDPGSALITAAEAVRLRHGLGREVLDVQPVEATAEPAPRLDLLAALPAPVPSPAATQALAALGYAPGPDGCWRRGAVVLRLVARDDPAWREALERRTRRGAEAPAAAAAEAAALAAQKSPS